MAAFPRGLLAVDFDGTLLNSARIVTERTRAALRTARDAGWVVVGATGRPRALAEIVTSTVDAMQYLVCTNGAVTVDLTTGAVVHEAVIRLDAVISAGRAIRDAVPSAGFAVEMPDDSQRWEASFEALVPLRGLGGGVADVLELLEDSTADALARKLFVFSDRIDTHSLVEQVAQILGPRYGVAHSGLEFAEVGPPGVSKSTALARLAAALGAADGDCIAFGDGPNDHQMLQWAGVGVAMGNAHAATIGVADAVTASNDDDGVAVYLEALLSP